MEICPVRPQSCAYHSATIWGVKCLAQKILKVLSEERGESVLSGLPSRCFERKKVVKEGHFFPENRERSKGLEYLAWAPSPTGTNWCQVSVSRRMKCVFALHSQAALKTKQLPHKDTNVSARTGRRWLIFSPNLCIHTNALGHFNELKRELMSSNCI